LSSSEANIGLSAVIQHQGGLNIPEHGTAGRPRASSRTILEDAALQLFLENGYAGTTIELIAQRAGVSRSTFFNYFESKSDLLWIEVDAGIDRLAAELRLVPPCDDPIPEVRKAMLLVAAEFGSSRVPLALTEGEVMGTKEETQSSGLTRLARRAEVIAVFLARQTGQDATGLTVRAASNALSGAVSAAWEVWAADGIGRGPLSEYISTAFDVVATGVTRTVR
jgi:AcrR family transcriptional regulator